MMVFSFTMTLILIAPASMGAQQSGDQNAAAAAPRYSYLHPGDVLRLRIWREPDMSGEFPINERGVVTLPKLGPLDLSAVPVDSLQPRLLREYQVSLNNPTIEVTPLRRVAVLGAVLKPGLYLADPTMTVADVLALGGGASPNGKIDKVELRRGAKRLPADLSLTSTVGSSLIQSGDQLYVPQRGWLSRNQWVISGALGALVAITVAVVR